MIFVQHSNFHTILFKYCFEKHIKFICKNSSGYIILTGKTGLSRYNVIIFLMFCGFPNDSLKLTMISKRSFKKFFFFLLLFENNSQYYFLKLAISENFFFVCACFKLMEKIHYKYIKIEKKKSRKKIMQEYGRKFTEKNNFIKI